MVFEAEEPAIKKRKEINEKIVAWILNKVKNEYSGDISLVLIYGSYINGTTNSKSDVDCYFIPKTERGYNMAVDFIIDGVGYDIFPISWERVSGIADLHENLSPLVGDVQVIYYSDAGDLQRFKDLQKRLKKNLLDKEYVKKIAVKRCEDANTMCHHMDISLDTSEIRKTAGSIIMTLADAVAVYNQDYYHFGLKKQFENLQNNFPGIPGSIAAGYKNVVEATKIEDVKKYTAKLLKDVCEYINITCTVNEIPEKVSPAENKPDISWFAELYGEIISTFNKIYVCCKNGNYILAFLSAVCLQRDLDDAGARGCPKYDLLGDFNYRELCKLSEKTKEIEKNFVKLITGNGGNIKKYDSFEQFEAAEIL